MGHSVCVGCWAGNPGELLKGARELGVQHRLLDRRSSFCGQDCQEIVSDKPDGSFREHALKMYFRASQLFCDAGVGTILG